jgi:hypothetical protein
MTNKNRQDVALVAQALRSIVRGKMGSFKDLDGFKRAINEIWSEVATADTYGGDGLAFVAWIREREKHPESADVWFKLVLRKALRIEIERFNWGSEGREALKSLQGE